MKVRLAALVLCAGFLLPMEAAAENIVLDLTQQTLNRLVGRLGALSDAGVYQPPVPIEGECVPVGFLMCPRLAGDLGFQATSIPMVLCRKVGAERGTNSPRQGSRPVLQRRGESLALVDGVALLITGEPVSWQWWVTGAHFAISGDSMTFTASVRSRIGSQTKTVTHTVPASVSFDSNTDRVRINIEDFRVPLVVRHFQTGEFDTITVVEVAELYSISIPIGPEKLIIPLPAGGSKTLAAEVAGITQTDYLPGRIKLTFDVRFAED